MGRPRDEKSTNVTINFDQESYEWLKSKQNTEWGKLTLSQVIQAAIKKLMSRD